MPQRFPPETNHRYFAVRLGSDRLVQCRYCFGNIVSVSAGKSGMGGGFPAGLGPRLLPGGGGGTGRSRWTPSPQRTLPRPGSGPLSCRVSRAQRVHEHGVPWVESTTERGGWTGPLQGGVLAGVPVPPATSQIIGDACLHCSVCSSQACTSSVPLRTDTAFGSRKGMWSSVPEGLWGPRRAGPVTPGACWGLLCSPVSANRLLENVLFPLLVTVRIGALSPPERLWL